jgi:hypothetical protein
MPRLRPRREKYAVPALQLEAAICVEEFRTAAVGVLVPRWQRRAVDDPIVRAHPEFFRGLVRLDEEVNHDGE